MRELIANFLDKMKQKNSLCTGLILAINETQKATPEDIHILASIHQEMTTYNFPLIMLFAGSSSLRNKGFLPAYLERAEWFDIS